MALLEVKNLMFKYAGCSVPVIKGISLSVKKGDFVVLCGRSGCGKTTFLRNLKPAIAPYGKLQGDINLDGISISSLSERDQASKIGYILQNPENQIVTDKVWHELAFGLESLGLNWQSIKIRVAEMASFFGIQTWFRKKTDELSGGQKQILNLASVMAMRPDLLILDEPTSQLDPIAASDFLGIVRKINDETGTTVIITEHRLEEVLPMSDRMVVMDVGKILIDDETRSGCKRLAEMQHEMSESMPAAFRIYSALNDRYCPSGRDSEEAAASRLVPLSVGEGHKWLEKICSEKTPVINDRLEIVNGIYERGIVNSTDDWKERCAVKSSCDVVVSLRDVWFRYNKRDQDVVRDLSLKVNKGEFFAIVGGNGTGKSTALNIIKGISKPYRGKVEVEGISVLLPQNPQTVFSENTIRKDLQSVFKIGLKIDGKKPDKKTIERKIIEIAGICDLTELLDMHPYDVSGGEQQRAALAKVLLCKPDVLLLDEPTKGMDNHFKKRLAEIIRRLCVGGGTVIAVSHDIEFCGAYADKCAMFFDGSITTSDEPRIFFSGNSFYTTAADKISHGIFAHTVTAQDVIALCNTYESCECESGVERV